MSDNPLVVIQANPSVLAAVQQHSSWGDEEEEVVRPRYIRIKQPNSENPEYENYKNGHFFDHTIGKSWEIMKLVLLGVRLTRRYQSPYDPGKPRETYCRSVNRKVPLETDKFTPPASDCMTCPHGQAAWKRYRATKRKEDLPKNPCELEIELLFIQEDNPKQPYLFNGSGGSREIVETMYNALKARSKEVFDTTGRRPELFEYVITMTAQRGDKGSKQKYFYPKFTEVKEMKVEEAFEQFGPAYQQFVVQRRAAFEAAQAAAATDDAAEQSGETNVVETPAQSAEAPAVRASALPPASKRQVGTRPVYTPPTAPAGTAQSAQPPTLDGNTGQVINDDGVPVGI